MYNKDNLMFVFLHCVSVCNIQPGLTIAVVDKQQAVSWPLLAGYLVIHVDKNQWFAVDG